MKRDLISQIRHEWKPNFWLIIELMIVSVIIAALMCLIVRTVKNYNTPRGFDSEGVYSVSVKFIEKDSPYYTDLGEETDRLNLLDQYVLINRLRANSLVEAAAASINCSPYNLAYFGDILVPVNDTVAMNVNARYASPDIVRVLGIHGEKGESMEKMEEILRQNEILVARDANYERQRAGSRLEGMQVYFEWDSVHPLRIGAVVPNIRRNDFEPAFSGMALVPFDESVAPNERFWEVLIRVRPGQEKKFEEAFNADESLRRYRNVMFYDLSSMKVMRRIAQNRESTVFRTQVALAIFFLLMVFLGLLGSFWYRVQQRRGEIAMRKICGACRLDIFRRLTGEGTMLLLIATLPALLLDWLLAVKLPEAWVSNYSFSDIALSALLSYVFMELIIIAGVSIPAYMAMRMHPAEALKDD